MEWRSVESSMKKWALGWAMMAIPACVLGEGAEGAASPVWQDGVAVVGSVRVDPSARAVMVSGWVNQVVGNIELLACGPGGKTHESVFVLNVNPLDLQTGLLLLGLKPGPVPDGLGRRQPDGTRLKVWVEWEESGKTRKERAEHFIFHWEEKAVLPETPWIFSGSMVEDGEFKALAEESLVATYVDPWAIVNIPLPCGTNDDILLVNTNLVPLLKTPIVMRFEAVSDSSSDHDRLRVTE